MKFKKMLKEITEVKKLSNNRVLIKTNKPFEYNLDGEEINIPANTMVEIEIGRGRIEIYFPIQDKEYTFYTSEQEKLRDFWKLFTERQGIEERYRTLYMFGHR